MESYCPERCSLGKLWFFHTFFFHSSWLKGVTWVPRTRPLKEGLETVQLITVRIKLCSFEPGFGPQETWGMPTFPVSWIFRLVLHTHVQAEAVNLRNHRSTEASVSGAQFLVPVVIWIWASTVNLKVKFFFQNSLWTVGKSTNTPLKSSALEIYDWILTLNFFHKKINPLKSGLNIQGKIKILLYLVLVLRIQWKKTRLACPRVAVCHASLRWSCVSN